MYTLKFMPDWGAGKSCLWSMDDVTAKKYGWLINLNDLPISEQLQKKIASLAEEYQSALNWDSPLDPSPWTNTQKEEFRNKTNEIYIELVKELGPDYNVANLIDKIMDDTECIDGVIYSVQDYKNSFSKRQVTVNGGYGPKNRILKIATTVMWILLAIFLLCFAVIILPKLIRV